MALVPLVAETLFHLGPLPVTNALVNGWIAVLMFAALALFVNRAKQVPGRLQNLLESSIEFVLGFFDKVTHDRARSRTFFPIAGTLFFFILLSNWLGLLPGTGSIGFWKIVHGEREFIPLLRSANSDLNLTLAMALIAVIGAHIAGAWVNGPWRHVNRFVQLQPLWRAVRSLHPVKILTGLVEFVVGLIEIFSELAKIASLSLRLFGNIFAGEVLLTVISSLIAFGIPLPFLGLELLVGAVQATVFAMLSVVYLTILTEAPHGEAHASSSP